MERIVLRIQDTAYCNYNPSSNPVERFHRIIIAMLRTRGDGIQDNWDLWINASVFDMKKIITLQKTAVRLIDNSKTIF